VSRSVLVTGGARGIGLAVARAMAADGHRVSITYRTSDPPPDLHAVPCDVTDPAAVDKAFLAVEQQHGPVEVLVSNAGITRDKLLIMMRDADFRDVIDTNLLGAFHVAKRAAKKMVAARYGRIIFISSVVGLRGEAGQTNYAASKAALIGLARSIARELGRRGITANVVAPGLTETDMLSSLSPQRLAQMVADIPTGRLGTGDDIAAAVRYLACDAAGYVNGAVLPVDGGVATGH
jgi:NAD(P)-dependent dehydrogenase (short-subunit alcohol dehydrogenase family)